MNKPRFFLLPMILLFVVLNGFFISGHNILAKWGIDNYVLIVANTLLLVLNLIVFLMQKKALENANPNVFVRSVMGGMMIKMFVFVIAIAVYNSLLQQLSVKQRYLQLHFYICCMLLLK